MGLRIRSARNEEKTHEQAMEATVPPSLASAARFATYCEFVTQDSKIGEHFSRRLSLPKITIDI